MWLLCVGLFLAVGWACTPPPVTTEPPPTPPPTIQLPAPYTIWVSSKEKPDGKVLFATIAEAIKAAEGRLIYISPGDYQESLVIPKDATVQLQSDAKTPARILAPNDKPAITVSSGASLTISSLLIEGGERGIVLEKGTSLQASQLTLLKQIGQAIVGEETQVSLQFVTIKDLQHPSEERFKDVGQTQGIRLQDSNLQLQHGTLEKTGERGVHLIGKSVGTILSSLFVGEGANTIAAISFQAENDKLGSGLVQGVTIKNWKEGIFLKTARAIIRENTIEGALGNAIFVTDSSDVLLEKNIVRAAQKSGISFSLSAGTARENEITGAGEYGIFAVQGEIQRLLIFEKNQVTNCKGAGIQIFNALAIIQDNVVSKSQLGSAGDDGYGIGALDSDNFVIQGNQVSDCVGTGIFLNRSWGRVQGNRVSGHREAGIFLTNSPKNVPITQIIENQLDKNHVAGLFLLTAEAELRKNVVTNTVFSVADQSGSGAVIFGGSKATIVGDAYTNSGQHGILVAQNSSASIQQSTLSNNKEYGILLQCGNSQLTEEKNTYEGNGKGNRNTCF